MPRQTVTQIGPWQLLDSECRYDNPWIRISHENVITPAGSQGIYGRIHFKNKAITIIPLDKEGNTWLVGQHRYVLDAYSWELPMGGGPLTMDAIDAAKKELQEEVGLAADHWQLIQHLHTSNSVSDEQGLVYLATGLTQIGSQPEETELLTVKKLPLDEAIGWALNGKITDAISVAALLKVAMLRQRGILNLEQNGKQQPF